MADRITQLQDALNQLADQFCNSIGILQQSAKPGQFPGFERSTTIDDKSIQQGHAALFATLIARTAKDIDYLIDSLPSQDCSPELQAASLQKLEAENQEAGKKLEEVVRKGEKLLELIQKALDEIATSKLSLSETI
ncbi:mediator of RNA polymerase II transcription subunit 21-like isoform X2 [Actinia tenebrosa]|uniref:Mediator of RNA polymerase II transcription subunit 21 n=1 Tax=Actinia tenebrosa TaxID=6105 RepID=A0A6P8HKK6_ACTTE|nr:mediator of RNA polymerase II transcription subunit 21-like isoform X2 [Actinia tenebrosa]